MQSRSNDLAQLVRTQTERAHVSSSKDEERLSRPVVRWTGRFRTRAGQIPIERRRRKLSETYKGVEEGRSVAPSPSLLQQSQRPCFP